MPIFRYFLVVGVALLGMLFWLGGKKEPSAAQSTTSQTIGLPGHHKSRAISSRDRVPEIARAEVELPVPRQKMDVNVAYKNKPAKMTEKPVVRERHVEYTRENSFSSQ